MQSVFWSAVAALLLVHAGYPLMAWAAARRMKRPSLASARGADLPSVALIVPACNEADLLAEKVANCRALRYPTEKLRVVFVTDGSTDGSEVLLQRFANIQVLHRPERRSRLAAAARAMAEVSSTVTVFSDAGSMLSENAIRMMARHFFDPTVGAVAGQRRSRDSRGEDACRRYESALNEWDAAWNSVAGVTGELFAARTASLVEIPDDTILEDFVQSMCIAASGERVAYEPAAVAVERSSPGLRREWERRVRISAGGFQAISRLRHLLDPFRYGVLSVQYIGHRVLRWTLAPAALVVVLASNVALVATGHLAYAPLLAVQAVFYALAAWGWKSENRRALFHLPCLAAMAHLAAIAGAVRYFRGRRLAA